MSAHAPSYQSTSYVPRELWALVFHEALRVGTATTAPVFALDAAGAERTGARRVMHHCVWEAIARVCQLWRSVAMTDCCPLNAGLPVMSPTHRILLGRITDKPMRPVVTALSDGSTAVALAPNLDHKTKTQPAACLCVLDRGKLYSDSLTAVAPAILHSLLTRKRICSYRTVEWLTGVFLGDEMLPLTLACSRILG